MTENNNFISEPVEAAQPKTGKKNFTPWALIPIFMMVAILVGVTVFGIKTITGPKAENIDFKELFTDFNTSPLTAKEKYGGKFYVFYVYLENKAQSQRPGEGPFCKIYDSNGYRHPNIKQAPSDSWLAPVYGSGLIYNDPWYEITTSNSMNCSWYWFLETDETPTSQMFDGSMYKVKGKLSVRIIDMEYFTQIEFFIDDCKIIETV
ncbi:MAG: hypothetical protein IK085_10715 [Clostridia bacterium]|nr:hypothetical protein [Clostridia bacterium]